MTGMIRDGRPVAIVTILLLLLTYLLVQSRSPGQAFRSEAQETLQALQLTDAALNRAVLMTRAGLLLHYDSLPQVAQQLWRELEALERESAALAGNGDPLVARETRALTDALARKRRLIEHFTSDYAVLRNSTTYFVHLVQRLSHEARAGTTRPRAIDAAHVLLRFVQDPESADPDAAEAALATIRGAGPAAETAALAMHGRLIVDLLPRIDGELRAILTSQVGGRVEGVQQALLQSAGAAETRAQRFRVLLYGSALVLLAYLLLLFARLRRNAAELRRKELQLIQANKMTALGMLVSSVAHEINNPNQIVLTNAGVLSTALEDALEMLDDRGATRGVTLAGLPFAETRHTLPRLAVDIQESARRIERIVGDLKQFARPGNRTSECFDVNDVVRRALRLLTYLVAKRTDTLRVALADRLPAVRGNAQHLEQVAVNLVVNALESLPARDKAVIVKTTHDPGAKQVLIEVRDEGIGMTEPQLAHLGEAFFTTKEAAGGTGLGIAISSSLVRLYGGQLSFISQPGKGTCATVALPEAAPGMAAAAGGGGP